MQGTHILAERRTYSNTIYTHVHPFAQLILPLQGMMSLETELYQLELNDQQLFFLPPDCRHTFYARNHNQFLVLDIPPHLYLSEDMTRIDGGVYQRLDERWAALRFLMLTEVGGKSATTQPLTHLFQYAYRLLLAHASPRSIRYLQEHFHEPVHLQELAALEGYNLTYYCEWFKKMTGLAPHAYLQKLRLSQAKHLLSQTDLSILQIAQQVGYEQQASLTRLFQTHEKMTPSTYRQKNRNSAKTWPKIG